MGLPRIHARATVAIVPLPMTPLFQWPGTQAILAWQRNRSPVYPVHPCHPVNPDSDNLHRQSRPVEHEKCSPKISSPSGAASSSERSRHPRRCSWTSAPWRGHDTPVAFGNPEVFTFEKWVPGGWADAYYEEHFGWEFKGDDADLDAGLNQLLRYQVHLKTPPLLIVSSFRTIRIQTNFPGMETVRHEIPVAALDQREQLDKLRCVFHAPADFRPNRTLDAVTKDTADLFHAIVLDMERSNAGPFGKFRGEAGPLSQPDNVLPLRRGCRPSPRRAVHPDCPQSLPQPPTVRPGGSQPVSANGRRGPCSEPTKSPTSTATFSTPRRPWSSA